MRFEEDDSSTPGSKSPRSAAAATDHPPHPPLHLDHNPPHTLNNLNKMRKNEDIQFRPVASVDVLDVDVEGVQLPKEDDGPVIVAAH